MNKIIKIAVDAMGGDGSPKKIIDGIIHHFKNNENSFYQIFGDKDKILENIKSDLPRTCFEVIHTFPDIPDDTSQQAQLIEDAIAARPAAILLAPTHPSALDESILKIRKAEIPFVYFVSSSENVQADTFVGSNNLWVFSSNSS